MRPLRRLPVWLAIIACAAGALPAAAGADAPAVNDCTVHLRLTRHYTVQQLQQAISTMSATVKEYTDCSDVLQRALSAELSGRNVGGGSGGSGGSFLPLPLLLALIVVLLVGAGYGVAAARRRRGAPPEGGDGGDGGDAPPLPPEEPETRPLA
jgi:hypothetical protein